MECSLVWEINGCVLLDLCLAALRSRDPLSTYFSAELFTFERTDFFTTQQSTILFLMKKVQ